jgi:hypothetical protein
MAGPYFRDAWPLIETVLEFKTDKISELAEFSVVQTCKYLGIDIKFERSSRDYGQFVNLRSEKRLIAICNANKALEYINPIGGIELYDKRIFMNEGINLSFLRTGSIIYNQFGNVFVENLSIIDVLMFNRSSDVALFLDNYGLV